MAKLSGKLDNALDETRMLMLGAQVLIGFQYGAAFQPGFERLEPAQQDLKVLGLALLLLALGFLAAPGAYHQIVRGGYDTADVMQFTNWVAACALLPFAVSIGIDVYLASDIIVSHALAVAAGILAGLCALVFWYGLEWLVRLRKGARGVEVDSMVEGTDLSTRIKQVLIEARVVLPGSQALLGFQFTAILTDGFRKLPETSQYVHLASLVLIALSIIFLMAPAAYHRIVERGEDAPGVHTFTSAMLLAAMVTLALGVAGDFYVVGAMVLKSDRLAMLLSGTLLAFFFGLWFGFTSLARGRKEISPAVR